jgi:GT2 family glycosyltransferase
MLSGAIATLGPGLEKRSSVPRLAIIIRAADSVESLEATLVSVLENRPADCEVLVALNAPYHDPYQLGDEVRFVQADPRSGPVDAINQALAAARSPFVHLLASGCTVTEGWTAPALQRFGDRQVAAVAPLVMDGRHEGCIYAAGLGYRLSGRRTLIARGQSELTAAHQAAVVGACGFAAFYRKAALELVGGFCSQLGPAQADVDLALSLRAAGLTVALEPQSRVLADGDVDGLESPFTRALHEERLFWRNPLVDGRGRTLLGHAGLVALELAAAMFRPRIVTQLAGRVLACCQLGSYARRKAELAQLSSGNPVVRTANDRVRIDRSHRSAAPSDAARSRAGVR